METLSGQVPWPALLHYKYNLTFTIYTFASLLFHSLVQMTEHLRSSPTRTPTWTTWWLTTTRKPPAWQTCPPPTWGKAPTHGSTCSNTTSLRDPVRCAAWATRSGKPSMAVWSARQGAKNMSACTWCRVSTFGTKRSGETKKVLWASCCFCARCYKCNCLPSCFMYSCRLLNKKIMKTGLRVRFKHNCRATVLGPCCGVMCSIPFSLLWRQSSSKRVCAVAARWWIIQRGYYQDHMKARKEGGWTVCCHLFWGHFVFRNLNCVFTVCSRGKIW